MVTVTNLLSIILDAITVGAFTSGEPFLFGTLMLIINLLFRPVSSLILLRFYNERSGSYNNLGLGFNSGFGNGSGGAAGGSGFMSRSSTGRSAYENIDDKTMPYHAVPPTLVDTGNEDAFDNERK